MTSLIFYTSLCPEGAVRFICKLSVGISYCSLSFGEKEGVKELVQGLDRGLPLIRSGVKFIPHHPNQELTLAVFLWILGDG